MYALHREKTKREKDASRKFGQLGRCICIQYKGANALPRFQLPIPSVDPPPAKMCAPAPEGCSSFTLTLPAPRSKS